MTSYEIIKLKDFLQIDKDSEIIAKKISRLTAPGENYGSIMLKVDLTVKKSSKIEKMYIVAKVPPDERTQKIFNTQTSFRNEIAFYDRVVPLLRNFQKVHGVEGTDLFPKYFGSRLNLNGDDDRIDKDGCLLLENLKIANYKTLDQKKGFDLDVAAAVVSSLAEFHAVPLTLRLQKKEVFDKEVLPYLSPWKMSVDFHNKTRKQVERIVDGTLELVPLKRRVLSGFDKKLQRSECREPFATIIHNDFWVNNVMVEGTTQIKTKIVDLQECTYASLAKDLVFFLFTSVKSQVLEKHYEDLVRIYYEKFSSILSSLHCDIGISFEDFEKELAFEAEHSQFGHILFMLNPIFATGENLAECTAEDLLDLEPTDLHKEKFVFVVKEFVKRNWI